MLLGDVFRRLEDEDFATETMLRIGDLGLLAHLRECAADNAISIGDYALWAVRSYADNAPPDEWTTLLGILDQADDPGAACLKRALGYILATEGSRERVSR